MKWCLGNEIKEMTKDGEKEEEEEDEEEEEEEEECE